MVEALRELSDTIEAAQSSVRCAASRVGTQSKMIAAMPSNDPDLRSARALLRQMQQNVAIEQMNITFIAYQAGTI